jgi:hypothetical protein
MKYREVFEADCGYRLYRHRVSILLQALSYGRRLTDDQIGAYVSAVNTYLDTISDRPTLDPSELFPLTASTFPKAADRPFFKYVSDETLAFISRGSFRFGSAEFYRATENALIQDVREGLATFHIGSDDNQLHASMVSGYNCVLFCGTSTYNPDSARMKKSFGTNLIRIENPSAFASQVCSLLGAKAWHIHDVAYTDLKNFTLELPSVERLPQVTGLGSLSNESIHEINRSFFDIFYQAAFLPSLFAKPLTYAPERERRIAFELPMDISEPTVVVESKHLLSYVHVEAAL